METGGSGDSTAERILFTHIAVPVMTRLKQPERQVLDTLVDAGVARSRSDALAWSVRLVGQHAEEWLAKLREAMSEVDDLRARAPNSDAGHARHLEVRRRRANSSAWLPLARRSARRPSPGSCPRRGWWRAGGR